MKLWWLTRAPYVALGGARYAPSDVPVVSLASEAGLAVLVALRYQPRGLQGIPDDFVLGWTQVAAVPERVPEQDSEVVWTCNGFVPVTFLIMPLWPRMRGD